MSYQRFLDALHPDDREKPDMAVKVALDNHKDYDIEYRSLWPDGSLHWLEAKGLGYYDATGRAARMEGAVLDITDRKRAEAEIRELIDGLLWLSRSTRGELRRDAVDLSALAARILGELVAAEPDRRVTWTVEPGLTARGDERRSKWSSPICWATPGNTRPTRRNRRSKLE